MSHGFYVYASWGVSFVVIIGMITAIWLDGRRQHEEIRRLEKAGIRRRSAKENGNGEVAN
jgi:heme exporter protein CcmD